MEKYKDSYPNLQGSFFQNNEWLNASYKLNKKIKLCIIEVFYDQNLIMVLPCEIKNFLGFGILRWAFQDNLDFATPIFIKKHIFQYGAMSLIIKKIINSIPDIDLVFFKKNPAEFYNIKNPICQLWSVKKNYIYKINIENVEWENFYTNISSSKSRQTDRKKIRSLRKLGKINFVIGKDEYEKKKIYNFTIITKARFLKKKNFSKDYIKHFLSFYKKLYKNIIYNNAYIFSCIKIDNEIVASIFGSCFNKTYYYLIPSNKNGNFEKFSLGRLILINQIKWAMSNKISFFNLGPGKQLYKKHWYNNQELHVDVMYSSKFKGTAFYILYCIYNLFKNK